MVADNIQAKITPDATVNLGEAQLSLEVVTINGVPVLVGDSKLGFGAMHAWTHVQASDGAGLPVELCPTQLAYLHPPAAITGFALEAGNIATILARTPALGQQLAAASSPVVLPALQVTAMTPPAAITGFALEAGHLATIDTNVAGVVTNTGTTATNTAPGVKITAATLGAGGSGPIGWLSQIANLLASTLTTVLAAGSAIIGKVGIDQTTPGTTNGVQVNAALPAGANTVGNVGLVAGTAAIGKVGRSRFTVSTTFTRPANTTAYTIGDVVNSTVSANTPQTFANVVAANGGSGRITKIQIWTNVKSITPQFRVHFFNVTPTGLAGDNLPYEQLYADVGKDIGYLDAPALGTPADTTNSDCSFVCQTYDFPFKVDGATTNLLFALELLSGAFTPTSGQSITVLISGELD